MPCVKVGCSVELAQCFLKLLSHQSSPGHPALAKRRWAPPSRRGESGPGGPLAQVSIPFHQHDLLVNPSSLLSSLETGYGVVHGDSCQQPPTHFLGPRPPVVDPAYE